MTQDNAFEFLKSGKNIFLTGEPGAGKTYTINQFTAWLESEGINYAITASTGIAATHINGTTIHSWSGIGINREINQLALARILNNRFIVERLCAADVLIVDEISMLDRKTINNIDYVLREARADDRPFGGLQVVFVGDFFQLPPVVKDEEMKFAFEAEAWTAAGFKVCYLTEQHRQNDPEFLNILTAMRTGTTKENHKNRLSKCVLNRIPDTKLFTHNVDVDKINKENLDKLPPPLQIYKAESWGIPFLVDTLKKNCLSPENLELKVGAVVMFTRNNFDMGYVNGTLGKVTELSPSLLVDLKSGTRISVAKAEWQIVEKGNVKASFKQYPLRLAWAMTIHKSQGMSLDEASVDLSKTFEFGQGYVAISRVRSLGGLHFEGINDKAFEVNPKVLKQDLIFRQQSDTLEKTKPEVLPEIKKEVEDIPF